MSQAGGDNLSKKEQTSQLEFKGLISLMIFDIIQNEKELLPSEI